MGNAKIHVVAERLSMNKTVIFHAGLPKTGTTYMQSLFVKNYKMLANNGICYSPDLRKEQLSHDEFVKYLRGAPSRVTEADIQKAKDTGSTQLFSAETLSTMDTNTLHKLKEIYAGYDIRIILYLREWSSYTFSVWQTLIRINATSLSFIQFYFELLNDPMKPNGVGIRNIITPLTRLSQVFGKENLTLVLYDKIVDNNENIFQYFVENILQIDNCIEPAWNFDTDDKNPSLPAFFTAMVKLLNHFMSKFYPDITETRIDVALDENINIQKQLSEYFLERYESRKRILSINSNTPALILLSNLIYEKFSDRIINPYSGCLFKDNEREIEYVHHEDLIQHESDIRFVRGILKKIVNSSRCRIILPHLIWY